MDRPLFVVDADWRFRYINPAGAAALDRTVESLVGRGLWDEFPEAVGSPFEALYREVRETGRSGSTEAWFAPLGKWFRADAFLTDAGLVVTYDDVTQRRHTEDERAAAVAAREAAAEAAARAAAEAETAGRHLMLLGDINLAMTSTLDTDEAVDRFAHLVVPLLADWCLISVIDPDGSRRDVGRAHSDPSMVEAMHRYADARVSSNRAAAPVPDGAAQPPAGDPPRGDPGAHRRDGRRPGQPRGAGTAAGVRRRHLPARRPRRGVRRPHPGQRPGPRGAHPGGAADGGDRLPPRGTGARQRAPGRGQPAGGRAPAAEPALPARAARPAAARRPVPPGHPGGVDRRRLVRRLPAARRRHGAGHRRRDGPRHRGRGRHGAGQDAGPRDRLRPAGGTGRRAAPRRPRAGRAGRAHARDRAGLPGGADAGRARGGAAPAPLGVGRAPRADAGRRGRDGSSTSPRPSDRRSASAGWGRGPTARR